MKIINYGHACFKIIDDDVSVIFDPYRNSSVPGLKLPKDIEANFVFSSHDHYDHDGIDMVKVISNDKSLNLTEVKLSHDDAGGTKRGFSVARVIRFSDYSICHMGDVGDIREVLKCDALKGIDIVLCPINGYFTISAEEAIQIKEKMSWKILIPMHYEIKEKHSGYPDGGQIDIFKKMMPNHTFVDTSVEISDKCFEFDSIIFTKSLGE